MKSKAGSLFNYSPLFLLFTITLLILLQTGCKGRKQTAALQVGDTLAMSHAKGFVVIQGDGFKQVEVRNAWDTTQLLQRYILVSRNAPLPSSLPAGVILRTPLTRVVVFSSVHCAFLQALGVDSTIIAVTESRYINLPKIKQGVASGRIKDVGESFSPQVETLVELAPEAILVSPVENMGFGRLDKTAIPLISFTDYMEETPLAKSEWIRFVSFFFEKESVADSLFSATAQAYDSLAQLTHRIKQRPTVFAELKTGSVWYQPGGRSYMAKFFADAGADYLWAADQKTGSIPLSFETVYERAENADFWLIKYFNKYPLTYNDLIKEYAPYRQFAAFRNRHIWQCSTAQLPYYEELALSPQLLLADLIKLFQPQLLPQHKMRYYHTTLQQ